MLLKITRRYLDLREELRFVLDKALFALRKSLLCLGRITGLQEKVLFLTTAELSELVSGKLTFKTAHHKASLRSLQFFDTAGAPAYYVDGIPIYGGCEDGHLLEGTGTSAGRAHGRARIVADPCRSDIHRGDILIAKNTDPGWTPILSIVGAMVIEEGGLLNHCSIVARELGIPTVVGVRRATLIIPDGARLTVDGGLGRVWIEDKAADKIP